MAKTPTIGVFEGGGARGLAHVGAVTLCEGRNLEFKAVTGTSAGAIVAGLIAAGYSGKDMLRTATEHDKHRAEPKMEGLFSCNFDEMIDPDEWTTLRNSLKFIGMCKRVVRSLVHGNYTFRLLVLAVTSVVAMAGYVLYGSILHPSDLRLRLQLTATTVAVLLSITIVFSVLWFLFILYQLGIWSAVAGYGFLSTDRFTTTYNRWLVNKCIEYDPSFVPGREDGHVAFNELQLPLTVVAQAVGSRELRKFSSITTPTESVALAVTASMAIPGVFQPVKLDGQYLIDGGGASSFPAWAVDDFLVAPSPFDLILGFRLGSTESSPTTTFLQYTRAVLQALVFGDDSLERRHVPGLQDVRLATGVSPWKLDLTPAEKRQISQDGAQSAAMRLNEMRRPPNEEKVERHLLAVINEIRNVIGHGRVIHLRANVALPIDGGKLRICCPVGFEDQDCDDRLEFRIGEGGTGQCWQKRQPIYCDLKVARESPNPLWQMNKYQQALVRPTLSSLLSVPIVTEDDWDADNQVVKPTASLLGVLSVDSDHDLANEFQLPQVREAASACAVWISELLNDQI